MGAQNDTHTNDTHRNNTYTNDTYINETYTIHQELLPQFVVQNPR